MEWKNAGISTLLTQRANSKFFQRLSEHPSSSSSPSSSSFSPCDDDANADDAFLRPALTADDIGFVLFLEPSNEDSPYTSFGEKVMDFVIRSFSQKPTILHTELLMPNLSEEHALAKKASFATYLGSHADYQNDQSNESSNVDFYMIKNGMRWRAIPVFQKNVVKSMRQSCDANVGAPYSIAMYPTSSHYFRRLSWIWKDGPKSKGHCATLVARVLRDVGLPAVKHRSAWYSPSSLYACMRDSLSSVSEETIRPLRPCDAEAADAAVEKVLRGPLSGKHFREVGIEGCASAIRQLTLNVCEGALRNDTFEERVFAEKELANALLRYVLVGARAIC